MVVEKIAIMPSPRAADSKWPHEITLDYFYQPHTLSILVLAISGLMVTAFLRDDDVDPRANVFAGLCGVLVFFLIISALAFPNGPFVRPHPLLWRMVFGLSVMYLMMVQFLIHQVKQKAPLFISVCTTIVNSSIFRIMTQ